MIIDKYILNGLVVAQGTNTFGKGENAVDYSYIKMLVGEEVVIIKVPQDKVDEVSSLGLSQYQPFDCLVDIKMVKDSDVSSKFVASISYAGQSPFNDKENRKGDKK